MNVENFYYYIVALPDIVNGGFCFSTGGVSAASAYTRFLEFRFLIFAFFLGLFLAACDDDDDDDCCVAN